MYQRGQTLAQRDRARRRVIAAAAVRVGTRVIRPSGSLHPGSDSRYDLAVATGSVDRTRWAAVVRRLMAEHGSGRKATFAKLVGVDPRTVTDWLAGAYSVRESMVRQVADKTGESA